MMWWLLFLSMAAFAQEELDLSSIQQLEDKLPQYGHQRSSDNDLQIQRKDNRYLPPDANVSAHEITSSGTELGAVSPGTKLVRIKDDKTFIINRSVYIRYFKRQDEQGFKYLVSNDGKIIYRVDGNAVEPIKNELVLYEPPDVYTPRPLTYTPPEYDTKLRLLPEVTYLMGSVNGDYMADLFNDKKARTGVSNQFGVHLATKWKLPIKVGGVLHFERARYDLSQGGNIEYSAASFGPQFKTKDLEVGPFPVRFQTQFRVSPFARLKGESQYGTSEFKFNSADLLASVETPIKNRFGEFVLGGFYQVQWLNMKDQPEIVSVKASNETNKSFGISFAQVID